MTATSRQTQPWRGPLQSGRGAAGAVPRVLLLLALVLGGLLRPERPLAAAATVVARHADEALAACARHALLPALAPGADVAAPQPRPEPLPLLPALPPPLPRLAALQVRSVPAAGWPFAPVHPGGPARLTSEVPNGP